ncbi:MAG TPA: glycosyltransferase family 4 protein [Xanthobacteraceae bacterium]|nr:glycosyltransferase family 4 protein [Xanthobacteraceae bacterium]
MDVIKHVFAPRLMRYPRRVLLLNGVVRHADAISRSLLLKYEALEQAFGRDIRVDVAAYQIEDGIPNAHNVSSMLELIGLEAFREAEVLIYEFGIFYELFDSIRFAPPNARKMAVWHNITPPGLAADFEGRALLERSIGQLSNMLACDRVICDSEFNAFELDGLGFDPRRISVLPLPASHRLLSAGAKPHHSANEPLRLLFVGRFVPAKGALDLIRALGRLRQVGPQDIELSLVGNLGFSRAAYIGEIREEMAKLPFRVQFLGTLDEDCLAREFLAADILVMPSYHEGYCLPVLEAFAAGCHVIAYAAGNLPAIVGQYGHLVRTGDLERLACALSDCILERRAAIAEGREPTFRTGLGRISERRRRYEVRRYAAAFSESAYAEGFLMEMAEALTAASISGIS